MSEEALKVYRENQKILTAKDTEIKELREMFQKQYQETLNLRALLAEVKEGLEKVDLFLADRCDFGVLDRCDEYKYWLKTQKLLQRIGSV